MPACAACGTQTNNPKYCSRSCSVRVHNRLQPKRRLTNRCVECQTLIRSNKTYCTPCWRARGDAWRNRTMGYFRARERNPQAHARIRFFARKVIAESGRGGVCQVCGYDKHAEVCHIHALKDFADDVLLSMANAPENLLVLCRNCHWEFDHGLLEAPPADNPGCN